MADSFVEEETALEKGQLRQLFERAMPPTDSQVASAKNTLNSARAEAKTAKQVKDQHALEQTNPERKQKERSDQKRDQLALLVLLDDHIHGLEITLADRYGEDFAENLAAEYLDEETFKSLMAIEDQSERRHAIAVALSEGIANGSIDPEEINRDPELSDWLDKQLEKRELRQESSIESELAVHETEIDQSLESGLESVFKV